MEIVLVAAMDRSRVIGKDGALPWHLPTDLRRFKALTLGHPVLMGRKTCMSLKRPLPQRRNLVLTRSAEFSRPGFEVFHSTEDVIAALRPDSRLMIIGGAEIYSLFLPSASRIELTEIDAAFEGDVRFPPFEGRDWRLIAKESIEAVPGAEPAMSFCTYVRTGTPLP